MIIGVDIGGTKTLVATFKEREITQEDQFATPKDSDAFLSDLVPLLRAHAQSQKLKAICVAAPGVIDQDSGTIVRCGNLPWHNVRIRALLQEHFDCPVYLENDANLAGLAEANMLHPVPKVCLYITFSTGIGTGIIINGHILPELSNSEAGHMMLQRGKALAEWEHVASGRALFERTGKMATQLHDEAIWKDVAERASEGLLVLIPTLHPSVVVIGGSLGACYDTRWRNYLEAILTERMSPFVTIPPILQAQHPKEAVVYGCRYYVQQHLDN